MPNLVFAEPGTDSTGDFSLFNTTSGTVASDTSVKHTGTRSIKLSTGNPSTNAIVDTVTGILADAGRRISFYFRFSALPATSGVLFRVADATSNAVISGLVLSSGLLQNTPAGGTAVSGTAVLSVDTWYRVSISYTVTDLSTYQCKMYINGVLDSTSNAGTLTRQGSSVLRLIASSGWPIDTNVWYDNIVVDDGNDYTDIGNVLTTAKFPAANNVNDFDTAIGANPANRWTNVNELPLSVTNGWQHAAATDVQENYTIQAASVGDVDVSAKRIIGHVAWIRAKGVASGAGTPKIMNNGTETAILLTAAVTPYFSATTTAVYPTNAAGVGMRSTNFTDDAFLYECGMIIVYGEPIGGFRSLLGVGR